jgi:hypothetical protein
MQAVQVRSPSSHFCRRFLPLSLPIFASNVLLPLRLQVKNPDHFVEWIPSNVQTACCDVAPRDTKMVRLPLFLSLSFSLPLTKLLFPSTFPRRPSPSSATRLRFKNSSSALATLSRRCVRVLTFSFPFLTFFHKTDGTLPHSPSQGLPPLVHRRRNGRNGVRLRPSPGPPQAPADDVLSSFLQVHRSRVEHARPRRRISAVSRREFRFSAPLYFLPFPSPVAPFSSFFILSLLWRDKLTLPLPNRPVSRTRNTTKRRTAVSVVKRCVYIPPSSLPPTFTK